MANELVELGRLRPFRFQHVRRQGAQPKGHWAPRGLGQTQGAETEAELQEKFERCLRQLEGVLDQIEEHEAIMEAGGRGGYHWSTFTSPTIIEQLKQRAENMKKRCDDLEEEIGRAEAIQVICDAAMEAYEDALAEPGTEAPRTYASLAALTDAELIEELKKCCEARNVWSKVHCRLADCIALMYGWTARSGSLYDPQHGEHGVAAGNASKYKERWNACAIWAEMELERRGCKVTLNHRGVVCEDGIMTESDFYTSGARSGLLFADCDADCPKPGEAPKIPAWVPEQWWEKGYATVPTVPVIPAPAVPARPVAVVPAAVPVPPVLPPGFKVPVEAMPALVPIPGRKPVPLPGVTVPQEEEIKVTAPTQVPGRRPGRPLPQTPTPGWGGTIKRPPGGFPQFAPPGYPSMAPGEMH